jgi:hypothetical protein
MFPFLDGIKRHMNIQKVVVANAQTARISTARNKYDILAERLSVKVAGYANEQDKLLYLRSIAHITSGQ